MTIYSLDVLLFLLIFLALGIVGDQGTTGHSWRAAGPQWLSGFYFSLDIMWIFFDLRFTNGLHARSHPGPRQAREKRVTWNNTEESQRSGSISAERDSSPPPTPTLKPHTPPPTPYTPPLPAPIPSPPLSRHKAPWSWKSR